MKKLVGIVAAVLLVLAIGLPAMAADGTLPQTGRVLVSVEGDVTLPAGERADAVIVVQGDALIHGSARTIVVVGGTLTLRGAGRLTGSGRS